MLSENPSDNKFRINIEVTNELASLKKGDFIVLPGVGHFLTVRED